MSADHAEFADPQAAPAGPGLLTVLWRRKSYLVLAAVVGLGLGYLDYLRRDRVYQSSAQLYVQKRRADPLPAAGPGGVAAPNSQMAFIEDFLATHEALIRSTEVLRLAADNLRKKAPLEKPPPGGDYLGYIAQGLTVSREKTATGTAANILNLSFRGATPADTEVVVDSVIFAYRLSLGQGVEQVTKGDLEQIQRALDQVDKDTEVLDDDVKTRAGNQPPATATPVDLRARVNANEQKRGELVLRDIELENRLKSADEARRTGADQRTVLAVLQLRAGEAKAERPPDVRAEDPLAALRAQEEDLLQSLGKDHPQVAAIRRRIAALAERPAPKAKEEAEDAVEFHVRALTGEREAIQRQTEFLDNALKVDRAAIHALEAAQLEDTILTDRRDRLRKRRTDLEDRQKQITLAREGNLYDARAINPPGPGQKVSPVLLQCLLLAVALGLFGGGGLAYLAEVTDKSFRTPDEIRRRLGLPVVGHIPALAAASAVPNHSGRIEARVVVHHRPKSTEAEAYRGVRTALYFSTGGKGHQVIQVTSPNPGDGKSTLVANLAVAIAQSGKRVVLIDCDFRKPRIHKIFGVSPDVGLASVIAGDADLGRAIQPSGVPGLSLFPCGPRPANPAELLTSNRFQEVLDELKGMFDFVLVDTPPLLAVSDPAVVAPRVDGVLLTVRITRKTRPAAERAREILATLGANVIGVVVNDLQTGKQGGAYGYGYGYKYSYNYGYGYADQYGDSAEDSGIFPKPAALPAREAGPAEPGRHLV